MSFDAGQFFNNLFNNIENIKGENIGKENKTEEYNLHEEKKILPDETQDEDIIYSKKMLMYAVPDKYKPESKEDRLTQVKYGIPNPEPTTIEMDYKYALPPEPTGETPTESVNPDRPTQVKYGIPNPEPTTIEMDYKYALPPEPTGETPTESVNPDRPTQVKYGIPNPEPNPAPTTQTQVPNPQPVNPSNPENPWQNTFSNFLSNLFGENSIFSRLLNNIFSRWR